MKTLMFFFLPLSLAGVMWASSPNILAEGPQCDTQICCPTDIGCCEASSTAEE